MKKPECLSVLSGFLTERKTLWLYASLVHFVLFECSLVKKEKKKHFYSCQQEHEFKTRKSWLTFKTLCPSTAASLQGFQSPLQTQCWSVTSLQGVGLDLRPLKGHLKAMFNSVKRKVNKPHQKSLNTFRLPCPVVRNG